jgi:hypothetical protein
MVVPTSGSPLERRTRNYNGFWGVLRPPYASSSNFSGSNSVIKVVDLLESTKIKWITEMQKNTLVSF